MRWKSGAISILDQRKEISKGESRKRRCRRCEQRCKMARKCFLSAFILSIQETRSSHGTEKRGAGARDDVEV